MQQLSLFLLLILISTFNILCNIDPTLATQSNSTTFIESSCRLTRYPNLCIRCLSGQPNATTWQTPQQLAQVALSVSLYQTSKTRAYLINVAKKLKAIEAKEYQDVQDCVEQINDGVERLIKSIKELQSFGKNEGLGNDILWHVSNVETWVSAALTDANMCIDGFPGYRMSKLKACVKAKVLNVAQCTSNALALFHHFAARYLASRASRKP